MYVHPRKSTVILSSNDVIACYVIVDVANFDLRTKNPRSAPVSDVCIDGTPEPFSNTRRYILQYECSTGYQMIYSDLRSFNVSQR